MKRRPDPDLAWTTETIQLPWTSPPLSLNDSVASRGAMFARAAKIRKVRNTVITLAHQHHLPRSVLHLTMQLHYRPRDNRRRDTDNLIATLKPCADAMVRGTQQAYGYGMVPDDTPRWMAKPEPIIHPAEKGQTGTLWLVLTWVYPSEVTQ